MNLACPRCRKQFASDEREDIFWMPCPACDFEFSLSDFETQAKRESLAAAWPEDPSNHVMLTDRLLDTTEGYMKMSFGEWVRWKFRARKTDDLLTLRSGVHQMIQATAELGLLYPAIPRRIGGEKRNMAFWTNTRHRFILEQVESWARDTTYLAETYLREGRLSKGEIRHVIDSQLPHASWSGLAVTYAPWKPELRGLLLAIALIKAKGEQIPGILQDIRNWLHEDGWNEHGNRLDSES